MIPISFNCFLNHSSSTSSYKHYLLFFNPTHIGIKKRSITIPIIPTTIPRNIIPSNTITIAIPNPSTKEEITPYATFPTTFISTLIGAAPDIFLWKQWKKIKTKYRMLKALGMEHWKAKKLACSRKGYCRIARVLNQIFSNKSKRSISGWIPSIHCFSYNDW